MLSALRHHSPTPHTRQPKQRQQGTGQFGYGIPAGDGFVTDRKVIDSFKGKKTCTNRYCVTGIEDPNAFFQTLMKKPYAQSVVWGPHFYAQSVIPTKISDAYIKVFFVLLCLFLCVVCGRSSLKRPRSHHSTLKNNYSPHSRPACSSA